MGMIICAISGIIITSIRTSTVLMGNTLEKTKEGFVEASCFFLVKRRVSQET